MRARPGAVAPPRPAVPAIGDYALVGDTRTAALISAGGSVDWMCLPAFDGPPLFGRIVDPDDGGHFSVEVAAALRVERRYLEGSAVLRTRVATATGSAQVTEGMIANVAGSLLPQNLLVRRVECRSGDVTVRVCFDPRRGIPGRRPDRTRRTGGGVICEWGSLAVSLHSAPEIAARPGETAVVDLTAGQSLTLVMAVADRSPLTFVPAAAAHRLLDETDRWWRRWSEGLDYDGPHRAAVVRSLVTLRLLTFSPSGAPVAAPTTSLPEAVGAGRNWDYRYAWPRDASIGLAAFLAVGDHRLARSFVHWLLHASRLSRPRLRVLYDLYGKPPPAERSTTASGYRGSVPVRTGNDARTQHQLDVYGWVLDAASLLEAAGDRLDGETWRALAGFADHTARAWRGPDAGIWEVRGEPAQYVHSKLMAWLALDRASKLARGRRVRAARAATWARERDALASWLRTHGVDRDRAAFTWKAGSREADAALLLLPVVGLEAPESPLVRGTIEAVRQDLEIAPGLLLRYRRGADGLDGEEGAFLPCSFWLVQALAYAGRRDEATALFETLLSYSNDVGLFSEEIDPDTKQLVGNFPQAFTHATLVQAALALQSSGSSRSQVS